MNNKGTNRYVDKIKEIRNKTDMMIGCKNRMCTTDDREELLGLYASLTLYAAELYHLNCERLFIAKNGDDDTATIEL